MNGFAPPRPLEAPSLVAQRKLLPPDKRPLTHTSRGPRAPFNEARASRPRRAAEPANITMGEPRDETWYLETKKRIREAFQLFDKDRKGCVVQEEVATIMRYLGAYPTERAVVKEILPDMMGEEASAFVKYETFEPKMLELLAGGEFEPDSDETLLQCFRAFDEEGRGYVEATKLREALITKGTPFREKEIEAFMEVAKDEETGRIYYEDYVALLSAESNA